MRIIIRIGLILCMLGCDNDPYSGIGAICSEGHPAVSHARSLSNEQLAFLYKEIYRLREVNSKDPIEYDHLKGTIPENLEFLDSWKIRPNNHRPNIMLYGCTDEFIYLDFYDIESEEPGIMLSWSNGSGTIESQVLWTPKSRIRN